MNNASMNIVVHDSFQIRVFVFSGYVPRSEIVGSYGNGGLLLLFLQTLLLDDLV